MSDQDQTEAQEESYKDISDLESSAEDVPAGIQSKDYSGRRLAQPGRDYVSLVREIKAKQTRDGFTFEITFTGGLLRKADGRNYLGGTYPAKTWISTKQFKRDDQPGETSGVAEYLSKFIDPATGKRYNPKEMSQRGMLAAVKATASEPVGVAVGWENKVEWQGETNSLGKKVYPKPTLKTADFLTHKNGVDHYSPEVVVNGVTYTARERVVGFANLA